MVKKILTNYALWFAIVFALMDLSKIVGNIGYVLYYPMVIFMSILSIAKFQRINIIYVIYLYICLFSILYNLNKIPAYYNISFRFCAFILLFVAFTPILNSKYLTILRIKSIQYFCLLTIGVVAVNFILFKSGNISSEEFLIYENAGIYTGSTANNEMGALGGISLIYMSAVLCFRSEIQKKGLVLILILLFSNLAMTFLASSRSAILCAVTAILGMLFLKYKNKLRALFGITFIILFITSIAIPIFNDYTKGIIEYKQKGDLSSFNTVSRDVLWKSRLEEFKSSPLIGIGWGTVSNPEEYTKKTGVVETGSGWLSSLSQTGLLGTLPILIIVVGNLLFLMKLKDPNFIQTLFWGLSIFFFFFSMAEGYLTTAGAILCVLFWCIHGIVYSMRNSTFLLEDMPSIILFRKKSRNI